MEDRRVRRTRRTLHDALLALVLEKGYEQITVQDILDRADIGRSTFYAHYRDKDALLFTSFEDLQVQLQAELGPPGEVTDAARPAEVLFDHAYRYQRIYRALCGRSGGALVHRHLHRLICDLLRAHLGATGTDIDLEVAAEFHASAALGLLVWWIDAGFPQGPGWLGATYRTLAQQSPATTEPA